MKKRLISLAMVFVLVLALGTVALATQNHPAVTPGTETATITVKIYGSTVFSGSIDGVTLEDGLEDLDDPDADPHFIEVSDWNNPSIKHDALSSFYGLSSTTGNFSDLPNGAFTYDDGLVYTANNTTAVPNHSGYFLLKTVPNVYDEVSHEFRTQYHYLYIGKDWVYTDNVNGEIYVYMCCYALNGQQITINYNVQPTAWATFNEMT